MRSSRASAAASPRHARRAASAARSAAAACGTYARPAGVRCIAPAPRSRSVWPTVASRARTWWDSVGWATSSRRAAAVNEPSSATARRYSIWRRLMAAPLPSGVPAPARQRVDLLALRGGQLALGAPAAHLGDPRAEREALAVGEVLGDARLAARREVVAHVRDPRLVEQVDLDPAAVDRPHRHLVEVAPHPVLAGLERLDHRMLGVAV